MPPVSVGSGDQISELTAELDDLRAKLAERTEELARSEHNYRRIFEVSRDMIVVTSQSGTRRSRAAAMAGWTVP